MAYFQITIALFLIRKELVNEVLNSNQLSFDGNHC